MIYTLLVYTYKVLQKTERELALQLIHLSSP